VISVIAHRGAHESQPQDSLAACEAAISLGCDYIETDLRTSSGGKLLVKHDPLEPEDILPSFDDVLALAKGHIKIYRDVKQAMPADIVEAVEKHGMTDSILTYGSLQLLRDLQQLRPAWPCMPEASTPDVLRETLKSLKPRVIAFSGWDLKPEQIQLARAAGCGLFPDRQGKTDYTEYWQAAIDAGATGIQTGRPSALLAWLRGMKLHA